MPTKLAGRSKDQNVQIVEAEVKQVRDPNKLTTFFTASQSLVWHSLSGNKLMLMQVISNNATPTDPNTHEERGSDV